MIEKYPNSDCTSYGWNCKPMECKNYYVAYVEGLEKQNTALLKACQFALQELNDMTTDEFSRGADKAVRDRLSNVIALEEGKNKRQPDE